MPIKLLIWTQNVIIFPVHEFILQIFFVSLSLLSFFSCENIYIFGFV